MPEGPEQKFVKWRKDAAERVWSMVNVPFEGGGFDGPIYPVFYRFTLNENMGATTTNKGDADILYMSGEDTGFDADVEDPLSIFSTLLTDDTGICVCQHGRFWIIQAPCP